ncbi:hypothetical protein ACN47E_001281 [Coniothyrium glycines]
MGGSCDKTVQELWAAAFTTQRSLRLDHLIAGFTSTLAKLRALEPGPVQLQALEDLWIFAAYTGLYTHGGLDWQQFVVAHTAPASIAIVCDAPTRNLTLVSRRIRSILRIQLCWPVRFVYRLRAATIWLPPDPACTFLETLASIALQHPSIDEFTRRFPPFLDNHMLNTRHSKKERELHEQGLKNVSLADLRAYSGYINTQHTRSSPRTPHTNLLSLSADISSSLPSPISVERVRHDDTAGANSCSEECDVLSAETEEHEDEVVDSSSPTSSSPCSTQDWFQPLELDHSIATENDDREDSKVEATMHPAASVPSDKVPDKEATRDRKIAKPHTVGRTQSVPPTYDNTAECSKGGAENWMSKSGLRMPTRSSSSTSAKRKRLATPPSEPRMSNDGALFDQRARSPTRKRLAASVTQHVGNTALSPFLYQTRSMSRSHQGPREQSHVLHPETHDLLRDSSHEAVRQGCELKLGAELRQQDHGNPGNPPHTSTETIRDGISSAREHSLPDTPKPPGDVTQDHVLRELAPGQWLSSRTIDHLIKYLLPDCVDHRWYDPGNMTTPESPLAPIRGDRLKRARIVFVPLCQQQHWVLLQYNIDSASRYVWDSKIGLIPIASIQDYDAKISDVVWAASSRNGPSYWRVAQHLDVPQQRNNDDCGIYLLAHAMVGASDYKCADGQKPLINPILWRMALRQMLQSDSLCTAAAFDDLVREVDQTAHIFHQSDNEGHNVSLADVKIAKQQIDDLAGQAAFAVGIVSTLLVQARTRQEQLDRQYVGQSKRLDDEISAFEKIIPRLGSWAGLSQEAMAAGRLQDIKGLQSERDGLLKPIARDLDSITESIPKLNQLHAVFSSVQGGSTRLCEKIRLQEESILARMQATIASRMEAEDVIRRRIADLQQQAQAYRDEREALTNDIDRHGKPDAPQA